MCRCYHKMAGAVGTCKFGATLLSVLTIRCRQAGIGFVSLAGQLALLVQVVAVLALMQCATCHSSLVHTI